MYTFLFQTSTAVTNPLTLKDWIPIVISILALIVSAGNLIFLWYEKNKKFKPAVYPSPRLAITRRQTINGKEISTLALRCGYENKGVLSGEIMALAISLHTSLGGTNKFTGFLVRDLYGSMTETGQRQQLLREFSTLSLGAGERKWEDVFFIPEDPSFDLQKPCLLTMKLWFCSDIEKKEWPGSKVSYSFDFTESDLTDWRNNNTVVLEATELRHSIQNFLIHE